MPTYIQLPRNDEELLELVRGYKQSWGFPNCGGAIDGCHIPISVANSLHTDYHNRKGYYSVILQGLVDCRHCFMHIYVSWPGSVHDARVFSNSQIYRMGNDGSLFPKSVLPINGWNVPVVILGDSAYPLGDSAYPLGDSAYPSLHASDTTLKQPRFPDTVIRGEGYSTGEYLLNTLIEKTLILNGINCTNTCSSKEPLLCKSQRDQLHLVL